MGFFKRNNSPVRGFDVVAAMERFGRHEIDPQRSGDMDVWGTTQQPLLSLSQQDPNGLIEVLAEACIPAGGFAVYGAERTVVNLVGTSATTESWWRLLDASTEFLRANFVPPMRIPPYMWGRFIDLGGTSNTWLPLRPPPARDVAQITPLAPGEWRRILRLGPRPDDNQVFVVLAGNDVVAMIDARQSDEDPTRTQWEWKRAASLYEMYLDVGWSSQVWDDPDPELAPFIPAPKALI